MSQGSVRVCGKRGLVVWCPNCQEWERFTTARSGITRCVCCRKELAEIPRYQKEHGPLEAHRDCLCADPVPDATKRECRACGRKLRLG